MKRDIWGFWPFLAWECIFIADKMNNHNVSHSVSTTEWAIPSWNPTFPWFFHFFHLHCNIMRHHSRYLEGCLYDTHFSTRFWACKNGLHFKIKKIWAYHIIRFETLCLDRMEKNNGSADKKDCTLLRTRRTKLTLVSLTFIASTILRHQQTILSSSFRCLEPWKLT